jgi:Lrp/AsnC family leucine-responsive transcriptional regulator
MCFILWPEYAKAMKNHRSKLKDDENSFDKIDLKILRVLLDDWPKPLQQIGGEVGLSPTSCWTRIKKLEAKG